MNYPPYDPNDPHAQPTVAGSYPQFPQPGQPSSPQWGQTPPPPFPQQPGQPTLKQRFQGMPRWERFSTIGCSTIIAAIMLCSLCAIVGNALPKSPQQPSPVNASQTTPTTEHQIAPTKKPKLTATPTPTPSPTPTPTASGPAILGVDIETFITKYGNPNDHSNTNVGSYHFKRYSGSNIDFLIVQTDDVDGGIYTKRVEWVTANASDTGNDEGWGQQQADTTCATFFPTDAIYKQEVSLSTGSGYDKIYYSASLANLFPASAFTDANQNQVQAGLFDVQYLTKSASDPNIVSCSILIGTQQTQ